MDYYKTGDKKSLEIFKPYLKFCNKIGYVPVMQRADSKIMQEKDDYYSNTLYLLAKSIQPE